MTLWLKGLLGLLTIGSVSGIAIGSYKFSGSNESQITNNSDEELNEKKLSDSSKDVLEVQKVEDEEIEEVHLTPIKEEDILVDYVLKNKGKIGCERVPKGNSENSIVGCKGDWIKELKSVLEEKDGWVLKGEKESINLVVKNWSWSHHNLGVNNLENPWIQKEGDIPSLSNLCLEEQIAEGKVKIICTNKTSN